MNDYLAKLLNPRDHELAIAYAKFLGGAELQEVANYYFENNNYEYAFSTAQLLPDIARDKILRNLYRLHAFRANFDNLKSLDFACKCARIFANNNFAEYAEEIYGLAVSIGYLTLAKSLNESESLKRSLSNEQLLDIFNIRKSRGDIENCLSAAVIMDPADRQVKLQELFEFCLEGFSSLSYLNSSNYQLMLRIISSQNQEKFLKNAGELFEFCLSRNWLKEAFDLKAKYLAELDCQDILQKTFDEFWDKGGNWREDAAEIALMMKEDKKTEYLKKILKDHHCEEYLTLGQIIVFCDNLSEPERSEQLTALRRKHINQGQYTQAKKINGMLDVPFSKDEVESMFLAKLENTSDSPDSIELIVAEFSQFQ